MYDQSCVKLVQEPATWTEARASCASIFPAKGEFSAFQSDLASILDDFENNFLTALFYSGESGFSMNFNGQPGAWIGFSGLVRVYPLKKVSHTDRVKNDFSNFHF